MPQSVGNGGQWSTRLSQRECTVPSQVPSHRYEVDVTRVVPMSIADDYHTDIVEAERADYYDVRDSWIKHRIDWIPVGE